MTTRELLRDVAKFLDEGLANVSQLAEGLPEFVRAKAANLRAAADRIDGLERDVADRQRALNNSVELGHLRTNHGEGEAQHRVIQALGAALARLDNHTNAR